MGQMRKENGREEPWELPYLGIGNENWTMRPEFYSDRFKLYASGLKGAGSIHQRITRIACGPDGADYNWTDTVMRMTDTSVMNGISLHYYTMPGYYKTDAYPWEEKPMPWILTELHITGPCREPSRSKNLSRITVQLWTAMIMRKNAPLW